MTDEQAKKLANAINNLAKAVDEAGGRIAEDQTLGEWIAHGLVTAVEMIIKEGVAVTVYPSPDGEPISVVVRNDEQCTT